MSNLLKLLAALINTYPNVRFGQLLLSMLPSKVDLLHMPDATLENLIAQAMRNGLTPRVRRVYLPIGLPGSGKSTFAKKLVEETAMLGGGATSCVCSTDDCFMVNGEYRFDGRKLGEYHGRNFQKFALALADAVDMVIVDNTNLRAEHREPYIRLARALGYEVIQPVIGDFTDDICQTYAERNVHGVPLDALRRMASTVQLP